MRAPCASSFEGHGPSHLAYDEKIGLGKNVVKRVAIQRKEKIDSYQDGSCCVAAEGSIHG